MQPRLLRPLDALHLLGLPPLLLRLVEKAHEPQELVVLPVPAVPLRPLPVLLQVLRVLLEPLVERPLPPLPRLLPRPLLAVRPPPLGVALAHRRWHLLRRLVQRRLQ